MAEIRVAVLNQVVRVVTVGQQGPPGPSKYSLYAALLNQTGTNAPVATIANNELSAAGVWSYVNIGIFRYTLAGAFASEKVLPFLSLGYFDGSASWQVRRIDDDVIELRTYSGLNLANGVLTDASFEIHVYP